MLLNNCNKVYTEKHLTTSKFGKICSTICVITRGKKLQKETLTTGCTFCQRKMGVAT